MRSTLLAAAALPVALFCCSPAPAQTDNQPPKGFTALFDGKTLDGWYGWDTKDPRTLWKMTEKEREEYKNKSREDVRKHWRVDTGDAENAVKLPGIGQGGRLLIGRPNVAEANLKAAGIIARNGDRSAQRAGKEEIEGKRIDRSARHNGAPRPALLPPAKHAKPLG